MFSMYYIHSDVSIFFKNIKPPNSVLLVTIGLIRISIYEIFYSFIQRAQERDMTPGSTSSARFKISVYLGHKSVLVTRS